MLLGQDVATDLSGPEALDLARTHRPVLVFPAVGLTRGDGYEATSRLGREAYGRDSFIVPATVHGEDEDRRRSRPAGFDDHIIRPLDQDALNSLRSTASGLRL